MTTINYPKVGQVWVRGRMARKVVSVFESTEGVRVAWERPDNDWRTSYVQLRSWLRWSLDATLAAKTKFIPEPGFYVKRAAKESRKIELPSK